MYNCSTWIAKKSTNYKLDAFHRKPISQYLNIQYSKSIKSEELYRITNQPNISNENAHGRLKHLGHVLRRNDLTRHLLQLVTFVKPEPKKLNPLNLVKTYKRDLGTSTFHT